MPRCECGATLEKKGGTGLCPDCGSKYALAFIETADSSEEKARAFLRKNTAYFGARTANFVVSGIALVLIFATMLGAREATSGFMHVCGILFLASAALLFIVSNAAAAVFDIADAAIQQKAAREE